jgi:aromatic ring-opening dioxygenase LigB subunit
MGIIAAIAVPHPPLLIPGVGDTEKDTVAATQAAYEQAAHFVAAARPKTLVIFSPHAPLYRDYFHISPGAGAEGDFGQFVRSQPPRYEARYDAELAAALEQELAAAGIFAGRRGERHPALDHGTMLPLHFLQNAYRQKSEMPPIVRVGLSGLSLAQHWRFGRCLADVAEKSGRQVALVASGDLSHYLNPQGPYGYRAEGPAFDAEVCAILASGDLSALLSLDEDFCQQAGECGLRSLVMLGGALEQLRISPALLSYEGPFGVGYAVATFTVNAAGDGSGRWEQQMSRTEGKNR